jgi:hypothetical protein
VGYFTHVKQNKFQRINSKSFDTLINNVHWIEFDEHGNISHEFFAPTITSSSKNKFYNINNPLLKVTQKNESWEIISKYAYASSNSEKIKLHKDVNIKHLSSDNKNISEMTTDSLTYLTKSKIAKTKDKIKITIGESILYSTGFKADFEHDKKIKLNAVNGHYAVNTKDSLIPTS